MRASIILIFLFVAISNTCIASDADNQAESFANIYVSLCMKNLSDLEGLRVKLKNMPKLPPEKAVQFLSGSPGDAWPVHDKYGAFVLALPNNKNICMVYARRADTGKAEKMFIGLVGSPLAPFVSRLAKDERAQTGATVQLIPFLTNGQFQTQQERCCLRSRLLIPIMHNFKHWVRLQSLAIKI